MKKYLKLILPIIFCLIIFGLAEVEASSGSTIFVAEPVVLDSYTDVEITSIDEQINEETSEVKSTQIFTNLSDKTITKKASVKLEDSFHNFTINSLVIKVNELEITEITKEEDNYIFYFQIKPNEAKKIEISYKTDNDLQNARIMKYSMDSMKGQKVKLYKISINLNKYDIPLVEKIWPGAYEFEDNTVSTEYFDFTVNNLTSSFIMQKDTYYNIKFGEESESLSDLDEYILENKNNFLDGNIPDYNSLNIKNVNQKKILSYLVNNRDFDYKIDEYNNSLFSVFEYALIIDAQQKKELLITSDRGDFISPKFDINSEDYCLVNLIYNLYTKDRSDIGQYNEKIAVGKMVAINYYETEDGKELYVNKDTTNSMHSVDVPKESFVLKKRDEYSILRTIVAEGAPITNFNSGIKRVYVNSDIDGNKIDISEEEIVQFVNMMNVDLYIRIVLYDPSANYSDVYVGYYTDNAQEIAIEYGEINNKIDFYKNIIQKIRNGEDYYSNYTPEQKEKSINNYESNIEDLKKKYKKFDNDIIKNNCSVPTIAHCVGKCEYKDGKYVIEFNNTGDFSGLNYIYGATECSSAKKMLNENASNNENIKNEIINKIANTKISIDTEEYKKVDETVNNEITNNDNQNANEGILNILKNPIKLGSIIAIVVLVIILIIFIFRRKKNGRKQEKN